MDLFSSARVKSIESLHGQGSMQPSLPSAYTRIALILGSIPTSLLLFQKRASSALYSACNWEENPNNQNMEYTLRKEKTQLFWKVHKYPQHDFPFLFTSPPPHPVQCPIKFLSLGPAAKALTRVVRLHDGHNKSVRKEHGCTLSHALKLHSVALERDPMHISLCAQANQVPGHCVTLAHVQPGQVREQKPVNGWKTKTQDRMGRWDQTTWAPASSMASALY